MQLQGGFRAIADFCGVEHINEFNLASVQFPE